LVARYQKRSAGGHREPDRTDSYLTEPARRPSAGKVGRATPGRI